MLFIIIFGTHSFPHIRWFIARVFSNFGCMSSTVHATRGVAVPHVSGSISSIVIVMSDFTTVELPESGHYRVKTVSYYHWALLLTLTALCVVVCIWLFLWFTVNRGNILYLSSSPKALVADSKVIPVNFAPAKSSSSYLRMPANAGWLA